MMSWKTTVCTTATNTEWTLTTQLVDGEESENSLTVTLSLKFLNGFVYLVQEPTHDWVPLAEFDEHYCKVLLVWLHKFNLQQELNLVMRSVPHFLKLLAMSNVLCMGCPHVV
jgi:hypothetical protein